MSGEDDDERVVDRMLDRAPPADAAEQAARAPYERLLGQLDALEASAPRPGWEERIDAGLRAARNGERRRRRLLIVGGAFAAAAVALIVAWPRAPDTTPRFEAVVEHRDTAARGSDAAVGDSVQLDLRAGQPARELRAYRDGVLIARCPGAPACVVTADRVHLELRLNDRGLYRFVAITSRTTIPPPGALFDNDVHAVRAAKLWFEEHDEPVR